MKTAQPAERLTARLMALSGALVLAVSSAHAAAPATDIVYRSMQSPYPSTTPFDSSSVAWHSFFANATDTYGFSARSVNMGTAPLGSFQGGWPNADDAGLQLRHHAQHQQQHRHVGSP